MGKNKNFKREERKIGGGSWADQFAALGYATTVDKDENKVDIPENAFINPYTFIPFGAKEPNRLKLKEALEGEKLYDGYLECDLEIKSSTFIPNTSKKFAYLDNEKEHYFYDFFSYDDLSKCVDNKVPKNPPKYPRIPGSEIRGMIRNVYEQLTNSCLSVIDEENLPYKRTSKVKKPALLDITGHKLYEGERYRIGYGKLPKDKSGIDKLWFKSGELNKVIELYTEEKCSGLKCGYLHLGEKFPKKHYESIIVNKGNVIKKLSAEDIVRFEAVLDRYEGYKNYKKDYKDKKREMLPVFYSIVDGNIYLSPAMITKEVFANTISDILRDNHKKHEPCSGDDGCFCPACRLFGMVGKGKSKKAIASRLRFTDTDVFENYQFDIPRVPEILGTPHYSATEFYLSKPGNVDSWNYDYCSTGKEDKLYKVKLNGRKVYWKGKDKLELASTTNDIRKGDNLKMRQAIRALKSGKAAFRIYFENITKEELGNLIFCINLSDGAVNRIGKGKPFGMGAVKTEVKDVKLVSYEMKDEEVVSRLDPVNKDEFRYDESFESNAKNILEYLEPLKDDEAEIVDYPKALNSDKIFDWFVNNRGGINKAKIAKVIYVIGKQGDKKDKILTMNTKNQNNRKYGRKG
jgi:hypothetical protein